MQDCSGALPIEVTHLLPARPPESPDCRIETVVRCYSCNQFLYRLIIDTEHSDSHEKQRKVYVGTEIKCRRCKELCSFRFLA